MVKNIDDVNKVFLEQMDYSEPEIMYKTEIDSQVKIFIAMLIFGLMLSLGSVLL